MGRNRQPVPVTSEDGRPHAFEESTGAFALTGHLDCDLRLVTRTGQEIGLGVDGGDLPLVDDDDAFAGLLDLGQNMGGDDQCPVGCLEVGDQMADLEDLVGIEPYRRFVKDQDGGTMHKGPGQSNTLLVSLGE